MLAKGYKFRDTIFDQPGNIGRYSGLIHFSLFQTGISRLDEARLLETILARKNACGPSTPLADNPAAALAAFLAAGMREGIKRLVLLTGDEFSYFAYRIAHLVSSSTTGNGHGLLPIFPQPSYAPPTLQKGSLVVSVTMKGQTQVPLQQSQQLCELGIPLVVENFRGKLYRELAFALTEWAALEDVRKSTIRLHLSQGPEKGLKQFSDVVIQAMAQIRGGAG